MKKLRLLSVRFDAHIESWELPQFRGAIINKVGLEHDWFHNHNNSGDDDAPKQFYRYPLVQYKCFYNNPVILFLDKGVDEAQHFFSQEQWEVSIAARSLDLNIKKLDIKEFSLRTSSEKPYLYRIHHWLALNNDNYRVYQELNSQLERLLFLQGILRSNILNMAKGLGWEVEEEISVDIQEWLQPRFLSFKGMKMQGFNFTFTSNAFIPDLTGLGRGASVGFGVIRAIPQKKKRIIRKIRQESDE